MTLFLLILLSFVLFLVLFVFVSPITVLIILPFFVLILVLLFPRRFLTTGITMGMMLLLITAKPLVDLFWDIHLGGFKLLHYYSLVMFIYAIFLILLHRIKVTDFRFYHLVLITGIYYSVLAILYLLAKGNVISMVEYFLRTTYGLPFFFLMGSYLWDEKHLRRFLNLTIIMLIPIALMGIYFLVTRSPEGFQITGSAEKFWRLKGYYHDASVFGLKMVPLLVSSWYLASTGKRWMYSITLVAAILMFYTYTRALWIFLAAILFLWTLYRRNYLIMVLVLLFVLFNWNFILERFSYAGVTLESPYGFGGRVAIWQYGIKAFLSAPIFAKMFGLFVVGLTIPGKYIHNLYLQWLFDGGVVGFIINFLILGVFLLSTLDLIRKGNVRALLPVSYLIFLLITGFAASYMNVPNVQVYLWSFLGMVFYSPLKLAHGSKGSEAGNSHGLRQYYHESHPYRKEG